jgi:peptidoglycan L-alanyl-D-glutamate endopeptidase CwlK
MSFKFGASSLAKLQQCDPRLQQIMHAAIANSKVDFGISEGHRDEATQNKYFSEGRSKVQWPNGKHNQYPSEAVDVVAYVNGKPTFAMPYYIYLYGLFTMAAHAMFKDVSIRSGLDWDQDGEIMTDQTFNDGCHFELAPRKR